MDSIDLRNADYEDVLHLYRSWKSAEDLVKQKNKELGGLKARVGLLEEAHHKFKSQIQALESVKELTSSLQKQNAKLNC